MRVSLPGGVECTDACGLLGGCDVCNGNGGCDPYPPLCEDGDVDQDDWNELGPQIDGPTRGGGDPFDADHDGDLDLKDFQTFQKLFTG